MLRMYQDAKKIIDKAKGKKKKRESQEKKVIGVYPSFEKGEEKTRSTFLAFR